MPIVTTVRLEDVELVVDENLVGLGRALSLLRPDVAVFGRAPVDRLLPSGILDSAWIPLVAERRWTVITDDRHLRTRPDEAWRAIDRGLRVVHLFKVGDLSTWDKAVRLLGNWPSVERRLALQKDGALWLSVRRSRVLPLPYEPGTIER